VLAVGADDTAGTPADASDDSVPAWGTRGTNQRHVDVVAPGVSIVGLKVPNGYEDERNPQAHVGDRFAKASGTSQATAVVSGEVALLLQAHPEMTPDQVKKALMNTARPVPSTSVQYRGSGLTDVAAAQARTVGAASQPAAKYGTGTGTLEGARGTSHVNRGDQPLTGEVDVFGAAWDGAAWARQTAAGTVWDGGTWRGHQLAADGWSRDAWGARTWGASTWADSAWDSRTWRDDQWSSRTWRAGTWAASTWSSSTWASSTWASRTWRDAAWSSRTWRSADLASSTWG
jgi:serine protease AprX